MKKKNEENKKYKKLKKKYVFHIILFIIIFSTHLLIYFKVYWIKHILGSLFLYFSLIEIIYIIIPTVSCILLAKRKSFKLEYLEILKRISSIFLIISITVGIFFSILVIINTVYGKMFRNECPFNLEYKFISLFDESFKVKENHELKEKCQERVCLLYDYKEIDKYPYKYLCNYNPEKDFGKKLGNPYIRILPNGTELKTYEQIKCNLFGQFYNYDYFFYNNEIIFQYLDICYYLLDFYSCERFEKPRKYDISKLDECPGGNYIFILGILCTYIIITDIFISFVPWSIENKSYNSIIETIEDYEDIKDNINNINNSNNINIKISKKRNNDIKNEIVKDEKNEEDDCTEDKKANKGEKNKNFANKSKNNLFATKFQSNISEDANSVEQKTKTKILIISKEKNKIIENIKENNDENSDKENENDEQNKNNNESDDNNINEKNNANSEAIAHRKQSNIIENEEDEKNKSNNNLENKSSSINGFSNKEIIITQDKNLMKNFI